MNCAFSGTCGWLRAACDVCREVRKQTDANVEFVESIVVRSKTECVSRPTKRKRVENANSV